LRRRYVRLRQRGRRQDVCALPPLPVRAWGCAEGSEPRPTGWAWTFAAAPSPLGTSWDQGRTPRRLPSRRRRRRRRREAAACRRAVARCQVQAGRVERMLPRAARLRKRPQAFASRNRHLRLPQQPPRLRLRCLSHRHNLCPPRACRCPYGWRLGCIGDRTLLSHHLLVLIAYLARPTRRD
jgi:hypothetical protein